MSDRSYVSLSVLKTQSALVRAIIGEDHDTGGMLGDYDYFAFEEVNYGDLDFLEALRTSGIAYDSNWESGDEYNAGFESCRFTSEGEVKIWNVNDYELNPSIDTLMGLIDVPEALRAYILQHKEKTTPLSWDNQEEYGKIYRATQLITPVSTEGG